MAIENFPNLIGRVIHNCGALELLINRAIDAFGKDSFLAREIATLPLHRRIRILRQLLKQRSTLSHPGVDSLCGELERISDERNMIAHNPIASEDKEGTNPYILVVRYKAGSEVKKVTEAELESLATRTRETMTKFVRLVPESHQP